MDCTELSEDHTGKNIADVLNLLILDYGIPQSKICTMTTDHGANILKAVDNIKIPHVDCFGHALNTALSLILKMDDVKNVFSKVKDIHNIFAHS